MSSRRRRPRRRRHPQRVMERKKERKREFLKKEGGGGKKRFLASACICGWGWSSPPLQLMKRIHKQFLNHKERKEWQGKGVKRGGGET